MAPAIVGNSSTHSSAAPIMAAVTSALIAPVRVPISLMTTMVDSDGTAEDSAKGSACPFAS
ncbi:hypothetical protein WKW80_22975 [Variovorax humicola]|uniref:Uncharacterized protein n=1 Tax=Variovorax humicola TaxID=1769758 RepID=A0ABU8W4E9_9BURK